ncbi:MAG: hypothetical protein CM15mP51_21100 [Porticoccaceae bacterium]|nr:MAG: hypothetical protein CM15mP51_21100 [Porticoccaceae bacterium]
MIKQGIPYEERAPQPYSLSVRQKMGRFSMPTIVFPDGRIIRDGVAIVDFSKSVQVIRRNRLVPASISSAYCSMF